jgi:hypothetical protein
VCQGVSWNNCHSRDRECSVVGRAVFFRLASPHGNFIIRHSLFDILRFILLAGGSHSPSRQAEWGLLRLVQNNEPLTPPHKIVEIVSA